MERRAKVELFEQIRREYEFGIGTIRGVAHKLGVYRRMVRQALTNAKPPERKQIDRERPVIEPLPPFIDGHPRSRPKCSAQAAVEALDQRSLLGTLPLVVSKLTRLLMVCAAEPNRARTPKAQIKQIVVHKRSLPMSISLLRSRSFESRTLKAIRPRLPRVLVGS
jgi:hypothetical protein